jgi:hypothetical protein
VRVDHHRTRADGGGGSQLVGGYIALLDVLGFSALVAKDNTGEKIRRYLDCLSRAAEQSDIDYVVFSDSIVLTAKGDAPESLAAIAGASSRLLAGLLNDGIALRGAIAFGSFFRSHLRESVFVAGRAVIDAYQFETAQDWVGIMVTPSALERVPDLNARCDLTGVVSAEAFRDLLPRLNWAAFIQPCHSIPFRASSPFDARRFDGYAVVPSEGELTPEALRDSISQAHQRLKWLQAIAPSPESQRKYEISLNWINEIRHRWEELAFHKLHQSWGVDFRSGT